MTGFALLHILVQAISRCKSAIEIGVENLNGLLGGIGSEAFASTLGQWRFYCKYLITSIVDVWIISITYLYKTLI